ncbi:hypothetical protein M407DRAFT_23832 [Tulasnella calospora MUT 4182]|uniref:Protein kinase domain-containing protein n=1 Tax=Tulasnella calospora MUT 4182 TaxID=1051891 RepID=A0A0C3KZT6_9AGAM|nr:hypothetical protein M407DRAFT_23832 [Tulasnella calospora MUT 4182]
MEDEDYQEYSHVSEMIKSGEATVMIPLDAQLPGRLILTGIPQYRIAKKRLRFRDVEPTARGGQGVVHQATLISTEGQDPEEERKVAVKKFHLDSDTDHEKFLDDFGREITFMVATSHPNIIEFIGFVEEIENGDMWLVLPWEPNGNVREFLQSGEWSIPERISLVGGNAEV